MTEKTLKLHISLRRACGFALYAAFVSIALFIPQTGYAASSAWAETTGGRMRVVALPPDEKGHIDAILEIAPDEGWHTYWQAPGNGGIPPKISLAENGNLKLSAVDYPPPEIIAYDNLSDYGYTSTVRFPLELQQISSDAPSTLKLDAFVGVCADICVPFQASFDLELRPGEKAEARETALVKAARALLPEAPGADFSIDGYTLSEDERALSVTIQLPAGALAQTVQVLAYDGAQAFKPGVVKSKEDGRITVALQPNYLADGDTLAGHDVGILVNTGLRAMETRLKLQ